MQTTRVPEEAGMQGLTTAGYRAKVIVYDFVADKGDSFGAGQRRHPGCGTQGDRGAHQLPKPCCPAGTNPGAALLLPQAVVVALPDGARRRTPRGLRTAGL